MSRRAAALATVLAAVVTPLTVAVPAAEAGHGHGPSARAVAAGRAAVARREQQVGHAAARVEGARAAVDHLAARAEVAVEAFNAARLRQQSAQRAADAAAVVLGAAAQRVTEARGQINRFAAAAYMSGGMSTVDAMLGASGPQALVYRVTTLQAIAGSQRDAGQALDAARVYQLAVEQHAREVLVRARTLAAAADRARAAAQSAVDEQTAVARELERRRHHLAGLLQTARQHASALERARLAALARARARAAARAAAAAAAAAAARAQRAATQSTAAQPAPASGGATGPVHGTVSAATGQRAVDYAESQIGKPYQWGAAGPDSYDCSGLTMWAYGRVGVHLDHWTGYQWQEGAHVSTSALRPGDLLFYATDTNDSNTIHHVGMYVGNGQMVEAPYTGANVRISSAWRSDLIGAVRPWAS